MRLTDEELTTLLDQINAPRPVREKVATVRANGHLTYPVLSAIVGVRQNTLEVKVHRLKQRRHREAQRLPDLKESPRFSFRSGPRRNGAIYHDHGPPLGWNEYGEYWEEVWLHPTLP
jgi:hypothetical protein